MKIVVTGAAGFIGSHTVERLLSLGHEVVGIDSFDGFLYPSEIKRANATELVARVAGKPFRLVEANICDPVAMAELIDSSVDRVCHLAALAGVRPSLTDPLRYSKTNLDGTTVILETCRAAGVERLAFASSSSVYGARGDGGDLTQVQAFREDDPCLNPASPYAATKRAGELLCSAFVDLYGMGISALRFFTVYGPRQRPDMAIHKFTKAIAAGAPITLFGDGETRRDYTYIDDIVTGTVAATLRETTGKLTIYNLGGTETTSLRDLVDCIEQTVGKKAVIDWQPMQPGDVPITFADITNSSRDLGYAPTTRLPDGVAKFWEWFRQR